MEGRKMKRTTKIGNRNVKVLRARMNEATGILVRLTRKMKIDGTIGYYVVVTDAYTGKHRRIMGGTGIERAWMLYKIASGEDINYQYH